MHLPLTVTEFRDDDDVGPGCLALWDQAGSEVVAVVLGAPDVRADADLLARAVNAHADLLAACEAALPQIKKALLVRRALVGDVPGGIARTAELLSAAIALAKGGS